MIAAAEFILVRNRIVHGVQAIYIRAHAHRFFLDARVNLRNRFDLRIHSLCRLVDLPHEVGQRLDPKIDPATKIWVREIAQLQFAPRVQPGLLTEGRHGRIIEARPTVLPSIEVRHPVRDIDVDAVNARCGDLPHSLHINLAPLRRVGTDPHILVTLNDPEGITTAKDRGLARDLALQPLRMVLDHRMRRLCGVGRDALQPRDVNERVVSGFVRALGHGTNRGEFFLRMQEALVAAGNVVVHLDAEHVTIPRISYDLVGVVALESVSRDAHKIRPILLR